MSEPRSRRKSLRGKWTQREEKRKTNIGCGVKEKKVVRSSQRIRQAQKRKITKVTL